MKETRFLWFTNSADVYICIYIWQSFWTFSTVRMHKIVNCYYCLLQTNQPTNKPMMIFYWMMNVSFYQQGEYACACVLGLSHNSVANGIVKRKPTKNVYREYGLILKLVWLPLLWLHKTIISEVSMRGYRIHIYFICSDVI